MLALVMFVQREVEYRSCEWYGARSIDHGKSFCIRRVRDACSRVTLRIRKREAGISRSEGC